ncbi:Serine/threonine-protein kinase KIN3 [Cyberlindnera fabianii]|nr:Serine/threonine-protein kinase KIN3 [Cyberlindnera fabianii]
MNQKERSQLVAECRILSELNHPNIVQYVHHAHIPERHMLFLYMEYCDGGDLSHIIKTYRNSNEYLPEGIIWNIFTQILMALYRCHYGVNSPLITNIYQDLEYPTITDQTRVIIHRDIKPDNIFLANGNFKLGDFGLAKSLNTEMEFASTCVGTPYYMSPEVLLDKPYSPLCDIWSLGCVIYELCALHPPFQAKTHLQLQQRIQEGRYPSIPGHYSNALRRVIDSCIQVDLQQRGSTFEILQDLHFKIQMKDLQLKNYEINLKKFEGELMSKEQELIKARSSLNEELNYQRALIEQEMEEIRINYQNEFQYVVEKEVKLRMKQIQQGQSPTRPKSSQQYYNSAASDVSMGTSPSPMKLMKGPRDRENESPGRAGLNRRPLQLINDDVASKKYTKPSANNAFSVPINKTLLTKNAKLFEKARLYDDQDGLPSPFLRRFNNDWV